jgi:hypothetical protein
MGYENQQRFMIRSLFYFKNVVHSLGVQGICPQPVKILGRKHNDPAVFYDLRGRNDMIVSGI